MTSSVGTPLDDVVLVDTWGKAVFPKSGFECSYVDVDEQNAPIDVTAGCMSKTTKRAGRNMYSEIRTARSSTD